MLLQIEETNRENILKLIDYANQHNLRLSIVDESKLDTTLPGKPLTSDELNELIEHSRKSGTVTMKSAHQIIRKNFNAD